jgi:hypothetical protein
MEVGREEGMYKVTFPGSVSSGTVVKCMLTSGTCI